MEAIVTWKENLHFTASAGSAATLLLAGGGESALRADAMGESECRGTNGDDRAAGTADRQEHLPAVVGEDAGAQP